MTEEVKYTHDDMHTAMCIMEEIADPQLPDAGTPWAAFREKHGINTLREVVICKLTHACNAAWYAAMERYEAALETHDDTCEAGGGTGTCTCGEGDMTQDPGSFDYEFVPVWLRECVDWSDITDGPRVRGQRRKP